MNFERYFKTTYKDLIDEKIYLYIHREDFETSITKIYIENCGEMTIYVYATVCTDYYYSQDNETRNYLTVKCFVDLEDESRFKVLEIVERETPVIHNYSLHSETLLPYIPNYKYEEISTEIIEKFFSDTELSSYIDAKELANRMGLTIEYHKLSTDSSIFGLTSFKDCNVKVYDNDIESAVFIKSGTIIVDRESLSEYGGFCSENFTIVHECVHWYLHRKYFFLDKEYWNYVCCDNDGIVSSLVSSEEDFKWIEYQANGIAARILLPYSVFKRDFDSTYELLIMKEKKTIAFEQCIKTISSKSNNSCEAIKIRLKEMGYKVEGIFEFVDKRYLISYLHNNNIGFDESYSITEHNVLVLMMKSPEFNKLRKEGNYSFIDNHFCFRHPKYITNDNKLTDYALEHMEECCILFKYKSNGVKNNIISSRCALFRANSKGREFFIDSFQSPVTIKVNDNVDLMKEVEKEQKLLKAIYDMDIQSALRECRETLNLSREEVGILSAYSEQSIKEIESKPGRTITLKNILRISIGLKLPSRVIYKLLEKGNYSLEDEMSQEAILYKFIIDYFSSNSIEDIDKVLIRNAHEPLFYEKEEYE